MMSIAFYERRNHEAAQIALAHGCHPKWSDSMDAYCCGCENLEHACDQQCSVITNESAMRTPLSRRKKEKS